jgi:hypothetical protein
MSDLTLNPKIDYSKIILSDAQRADVSLYVADEVVRLARFTLDAEAAHIPEGLLNGIPREVWQADMTPAERAVALRANSYARRMIVVLYRLGKMMVQPPAALTAPRPSTAPRPATAAPTVADDDPRVIDIRGSWLPPAERVAPTASAPARVWVLPTDVMTGSATRTFVACSGGCGRLVAARAGRAAVIFCTPHGGQRTYTKRPPRDLRNDGHKKPRARVSAVCSASD